MRKSSILVFALHVFGCSEGETSQERCVPGATAQCACANGALGAQACNEDGRYGPCQCRSDPSDAPGTGGASNMPDGDAGEGGEAMVEAAEDCAQLSLNFTQDTTLAKGCYIAMASPSFAEDATLTIAPGVTIFFAANSGFIFRSGQSLQAYGTAEEPIVLTGLTKAPGFWQGLIFDQTGTRNGLRHVTIEYGGGETVELSSDSARANVVTFRLE